MVSTKIRKEKAKKMDEFKMQKKASKIMILTDYRGMTVKEMNDLRNKLYESKSVYKVFKNTLAEKALGDGFKEVKELLSGSVAIVFGEEEVVAPAKAVVEFSNEFDKPKILGGLMDENFVEEKVIQDLAKLPSREKLLAKLMASLQSPLYGFVNVLQGSLRKLIYGLIAVKDKKTQGGEK